MTGFNSAAWNATLVCGFLIGLAWAVSAILSRDLAERVKWALLPSVAVVWPTVLLLRLT